MQQLGGRGDCHWNVLCDFDGTISLEDVCDSLLNRFGLPGWQALEQDWIGGRIGSLECMAGQVALLDCSEAEMDAHLDQVVIDPHFEAFAAALHQRRWPLTIVSDGLDRVVRHILARHGLDHLPIVANRLEPVGPRRWRLGFPHARAGCASGTCKCAFVPGPGSRVLMIGDGASDFCVAGRADQTWARKRLLDHCIAQRLPHRAVLDFKQALALLPELARQGDALIEEPTR